MKWQLSYTKCRTIVRGAHTAPGLLFPFSLSEAKEPSILAKAIPKSISILGKINWKWIAKWGLGIEEDWVPEKSVENCRIEINIQPTFNAGYRPRLWLRVRLRLRVRLLLRVQVKVGVDVDGIKSVEWQRRRHRVNWMKRKRKAS